MQSTITSTRATTTRQGGNDKPWSAMADGSWSAMRPSSNTNASRRTATEWHDDVTSQSKHGFGVVLVRQSVDHAQHVKVRAEVQYVKMRTEKQHVKDRAEKDTSRQLVETDKTLTKPRPRTAQVV